MQIALYAIAGGNIRTTLFQSWRPCRHGGPLAYGLESGGSCDHDRRSPCLERDGGAQWSRTMRVLLIEDHPIVRAACRRLLEVIGGIEIMEAATAADGFDLADGFSPDIIVLDLKLPDGSGLSLLRRLVA